MDLPAQVDCLFPKSFVEDVLSLVEWSRNFASIVAGGCVGRELDDDMTRKRKEAEG
jgi:hypothetical protein